jgi:hypothetical protein
MTTSGFRGGGGDVMPATIGKHPDYDRWPKAAKFPVIDGVQWMLTTDGCYFVRLDGVGKLVPATRRCWHEEIGAGGMTVFCGVPLHPDASAVVTSDGTVCRKHRRREPCW